MSESTANRLDVPELLPARMVNEYVYCPRLFYLEWVQGEWRDNAETADGRFQHLSTVSQKRGKAVRKPAQCNGDLSFTGVRSELTLLPLSLLPPGRKTSGGWTGAAALG